MNNTEKLKMLYGFLLLLMMGGLALAFGIGHVEEKTSYGLMPIVTALSTLAGGFTTWAFSHHVRDSQEKKDQKPQEGKEK